MSGYFIQLLRYTAPSDARRTTEYYCAQPRLQALQLNENPSSKGEFGIREFGEKVQNYVKTLPNVAKLSKKLQKGAKYSKIMQKSREKV